MVRGVSLETVPRRAPPPRIAARPGPHAAVPAYALVSPEQAESALGRNPADLSDPDEDMHMADADERAEQEVLVGTPVNGEGWPYECMVPPMDVTDTANTFGLHPPLLPGTLGAQAFAISKEGAQEVLQKSLKRQREDFEEEALGDDASATLQAAVDMLDPTQKIAYDIIAQWAAERSQWTADACAAAVPPPLDFLLLGTAGSGKTHTVKCIVQRVRQLFKNYDAVVVCAHTGVASANVGGGASTIDSIFKLRGAHAESDLEGAALDSFVEIFQGVELLVIDEISMVGAYQLEMMHRRLQQVQKVVCRRRFGAAAECRSANFGGIGVLKIGDFAQLPPIMATSLLCNAAVQEKSTAGIAGTRAKSGQRRFAQATHVVRLRRIHRQLGADPFKESTMRLRDAAMTLEDYSLWQQHELQGPSGQRPAWQGGEDLEEKGLHLVVENAICGRINGERLRHRVAAASAVEACDGLPHMARLCPADNGSLSLTLPDGRMSRGSTTQASCWRHWAVKMKAHHDNQHAKNRPADQYRQLRRTSYLCLGAPVMLTQNWLWDQHTVPLSLMNGARGVVVAILYPGDAGRVDGLDPPCRHPKGPELCPLPDYVVVHFPEYKGSAFFPGYNLPRTWVPVPAAKVQNEKNKALSRVAIPLKLCWALTVHKSQGLTCGEGVVVDLSVTKGSRNPIATPGVAFVAWTRATSWPRVAFRALPPLSSFLDIRKRPDFLRRAEFEKWADEQHDATMNKHGVTPETELRRAAPNCFLPRRDRVPIFPWLRT